MNKLSISDLEGNASWEKAVIVFSQESFDRNYSVIERSYEVMRDNKYFCYWMNGSSLFGNCLDGKDNGVRLDVLMHLSSYEGKKWEVEYCYIIK